MKFYQLLFFSKIFSLNLCEIPQTTGSSCLTTRNTSHYTSPTCLSCLLKRLANGSLPWVSLPCQEASEFLGFRLNASFPSFPPSFSALCCFAPCPTSETMGSLQTLYVPACLFKGAVPGALHVSPCSCLWGAAPLTSPSRTNCTFTFYFQRSHCFEGRVGLEKGSIFLAPFHFL